MTSRLGGISKIAVPLALAATQIAGCTTSTAVPLSAEAAAARPTGEYKLGVGDKLRVTVYNERDLSGEFQVSGGGAITMPLIGNVPAAGLTARELEKALVARLQAGYLTKASVAVEVFSFRPFFVLGEVERPGSFSSQEGMTVLGAIATAGGFTYRANTRKVFIRRADDTQEYEIDPSQPIKITPGDVVRVGERHF